ncbi:MAG: Elongation factor 4 [Candidatus Giovannonibacteria bacterium GW2011_GWC2_44_9]|uniref:Elongation factor 4 n=3 Tax=Candidatus Giovannoniibacteriota TaxID=1752738 RepID=A0A0G1IYV8_9BACT|nr:MAG: Elongation factor 4 [Candidatus Giovannonibacteria bacterium GW2011_GWB1_44_23]KKT64168.1 MAG: Elongation factor 4 [Candidatus Giovannonibacteria bacterium GW2011_GWA1_44_29]KKT83960.1 MAG: Elongation factor 4 [Candidatus Giovannonibacteria bacterium GW2011_GWC2_44_9]KKT91768.1 MAG: Elongation factor 4 [Parcubacteria group bacterium GW2011_GWC1_45_13]
MPNIRNFCIIAHIDHGKSTLADRMLEITNTIEKRKMREQFLDMHPLERERGITIKMQPVRMNYKNYILNLIDTPGHIDFNYEVSRALAAVEGAILLVDATQGVEAQTLSNVELAKSLNLKIIPVINKIDLPQARIAETKEEIKNLFGEVAENILLVSAKTGEGVENLLEEIVKKIPSPDLDVGRPSGRPTSFNEPRALIFDFEYSAHRGVIAHARIFDGEIKKGLKLKLAEAKEIFTVGEVGIFKPELEAKNALAAGEIGYIVTGIKEAKVVRVGDTILRESSDLPALAGYKEIMPVVFSSIYPEDQDRFGDLRRALERLKLVDSAIFFEEESSGVLGRGFRCGFLGALHLEIVVERLTRDFGVKVIAAMPTVKYKIKTKKGEFEIYSPHKFPDEHEILEVLEPYITIEILAPPEKLSGILKLLGEHEAKISSTTKFSESRIKIDGEMPLRELMRDFFDALKSVSQGYASLGYEFLDSRPADLVKLDVWVAEEIVPAFSRIVSHARLEYEAEAAVEKLYNILPRALFSLKIQAKAQGRILASRSLKAMSKDVTGYLYGGDRSRKMKLWKKQKEGKKRLGARADYNIPPEVYLKMIRK